MGENKALIDELSKMPNTVVATAYLYALNYIRYGVDITEKWKTAIENVKALEKAYQEGYHEGLQVLKNRMFYDGRFKTESEDKERQRQF